MANKSVFVGIARTHPVLTENLRIDWVWTWVWIWVWEISNFFNWVWRWFLGCTYPSPPYLHHHLNY